MFHVKHLLQEGLKELKITTVEEKLNKLIVYIGELLRWNEKINLISRDLTKEDVVKKLILPSLIPHRLILPKEHILDFGAGAGIVGIPLSIFKSETSFTFLESKTKPITFLRHIRNILSIDIEMLHKFIDPQEGLTMRYNSILVRGVDPESVPPGIGEKLIYYGEYKGDKLKIKSSLSWKTYKVSVLS